MTGPELRDNIQLLPTEPPPFLSLMAERTEVPDLTGYIPRGIDWVLMKYEIPLSILTEIQREAYPDSKFDISSTERGLEKSLYMSNLKKAGLDKSRIVFTELNRTQFINDLIERLQERPEILRVADWTAALMIAFDIERARGNVPEYDVTAFGFDMEDTFEDRFLFGAFSFTEERGDPSDEPKTLNIGDYEFPVKVRYGEWINDSIPFNIHPVLGTAACWAISRHKNVERVGLLTAAHLLKPPAIGSRIETECGSGKVISLAPGAENKWGMDAMLVSSPCSPLVQDLKSNHRHISPQQFFGDFSPGYFRGKMSGYVETSVSLATEHFGTLSLDIMGRVVTAKCGRRGDSGALIMTNRGEGAGIYTKKFRDEDGIYRGFGMYLAQVAHWMKLELYEL